MEDQLQNIEKIGYLLLKKGIVDTEILTKVLSIKNSSVEASHKNLAQILVEDLKFDYDLIYSEIALLYGFREVKVEHTKSFEKRIENINKLLGQYDEKGKSFLSENNTLPFGTDTGTLNRVIFASIDPTNKNLARIPYLLGVNNFEIQFIRKIYFEKINETLFPKENEYLKLIENSQEDLSTEIDEIQIDEQELDEQINSSALINLVEASLIEGVRQGASDIHIVPKSGNVTEINFRIDGKLSVWTTQRNTYPEAVTSVVKDRARGLDRFEREAAQDGFIQREIDNNIIRFRVSVLPLAGAELKNKFETIVIRILDDRKVIKDLSKLGLSGYALTSFQKSINKPQGMVILTGPTGSGKSTTLIAALYQVIDPTKNVLTVEDPVEYVIEGARQLKIGHKMNFDQAIRAILRHDPDIVLVGEMRDKETAETAIKLANTGHLTFSTLHTNDAPSAIARLYKMGIEPFLIAYAINIVIAQRLIRRLCEKCKKKVGAETLEQLSALGINFTPEEIENIYDAVGCEHCNNTGYRGRLAIHEALYFTKEIREAIVKSSSDIDENILRTLSRKNGSLSLRDSGMQKVLLGYTSIHEVLSTTTDDS
ncbi:MAG: GspE/PulE family protein [Melioribacteraceae bacterium]|nr:GspE/PulE family protein [Melioribacteraceae bacterium]